MKLESLLSRIHGFTEDSILITEAEPISEPGPRILFVNKAFERATGYTAEEMIGQSPRILQGEGTSAEARARIRNGLEKWQPIREELLNYRKDGSEFWVELSIVPVADESGWFHYWVSIQRDITARKQMEDELRAQRDRYHVAAETDDLTGLLNRRGLMEAAGSRLGQPCGNDTVSVSVIDLDRFKTINDSLGHAAGDAVLGEIANRLVAAASGQDIVARMGGDEFLLMRSGRDLSPLRSHADDLQAALGGPITHKGHTIVCHACVGSAEGSGEDFLNGTLFRRADLALYAAKSAGRGRAMVFREDMERRFFDRSLLAAELHFALEHGGLSVAFMQKVDASSGELIGLESLVRWQHPVHGDISPDVFIPIAEDAKMIEMVDSFVFREVVATWRRLAAEGTILPPISVNVSARRLRDHEFLQDLDALDVTGREISIELVETILFDKLPETELETLRRIRERGIALEIDDFGSGHASILSLVRIKPDWLKIDRRFTSEVTRSAEGREIIHAIVSIAKATGVRVIAEGVETREQAEALRELGCDALQGFLYGRPTDLIAATTGARAQNADEADGLRPRTRPTFSRTRAAATPPLRTSDDRQSPQRT